MINLATALAPSRTVLALRAQEREAAARAANVLKLVQEAECLAAHARLERQHAEVEDAKRLRAVKAEIHLAEREFLDALTARIFHVLANRPKRTPAPHAKTPPKGQGARRGQKA